VTNLKTTVREHRADAAMTFMVLVWGINFIVVKDAVSNIHPLTFNSARFIIGLPLLLVFGVVDRRWLSTHPREIGLIALLSVTGPVLYQIGFTTGLQYTTATNAALLVATIPTWTSLFSILMGLVQIRRRLVTGMLITLGGVTLVVLSRSDSGLALSHDDVVGSLLILGAAAANGMSNVLTKPVVDRVGSMQTAIWKYIFTTIGLTLVALPELMHTALSDIPVSTVPNIMYSGMMSGVGGFIVVHLAVHEIGPTRSSSYFNYNPIVAGIAGILVLSEPFSIWLIVGGGLTIFGVSMVRANTYMRKRPAPQPAT